MSRVLIAFPAILLVLAGTLVGGCIDRAASNQCVPRTPQWNVDCPEKFLVEYILHPVTVGVSLTSEEKVEVAFRLENWHDAPLTIMELQGMAGLQAALNQTLNFSSVSLPLVVGARASVELRPLTDYPLMDVQTHVFYGITFRYNDPYDIEKSHLINSYSRCYAREGQAGVFVSSIPDPRPGGSTIDCLSEKYLSQGEVSKANLIVHDFGAVKHAFPGPQILGFWDKYRSKEV